MYDYDVLGSCYPFEGDKVTVHWFRGKVIIVSRENTQGAGKMFVEISFKRLNF